MKKTIFAVIFFLLFLNLPSWADDLTVLYFQRPPYYNTINNHADGLLVKLSRKIFKKADIEPDFIENPPARIMATIKSNQKRVCSIGWFKNEERKSFAKFSLPIYRNKPLVILTTIVKQNSFDKHKSIKDVFADQTLTLSTIDSFSYGKLIDAWINNYAPKIHEISSNQSLLPRLIYNNRASYMLIAPEEINMMLHNARLDEKLFTAISKPDIPVGNQRYIIYSNQVPDSVVNRINNAIMELDIAPGTLTE